MLIDHAEENGDQCAFPRERWATIVRSHDQHVLHDLGEYLVFSYRRYWNSDRRRTEDPQTSTDLAIDTRYCYSTESGS